MKPPAFAYHDPETIEDALALLGTLENAKLLAGGQSLMPMLNMRFVLPDHVVDLNRIAALSGITVTPDTLSIGAMTRQREIEFSETVAVHCPILREALLQVGHRQTRNRGTIGGSLCHLDPAAELPTVALALDARIQVAGSGGLREVAIADFPLAYMTPSIAADEIVLRIDFPLHAMDGFAFEEFARRHGDFAMASVAVLLQLDAAGRIARSAVAIGGVESVPRRMAEIEALLLGKTPGDALWRECAACCAGLDALGDVHAPADYRRHLAGVLVRRALAKAAARAGTKGAA